MMAEVLKPDDAAGMRDAVAWAAAEETPLEVIGRGSKRGLGRPVQAAHQLDVSALAGIDLYEPNIGLTLRAPKPRLASQNPLSLPRSRRSAEP